MTQTPVQTGQPSLGVLPVSITLLEYLFCLPEGYKIIACAYNIEDGIIFFTLQSDELPPLQDARLPHLQLHVTVETLPDQPQEYRKITTEVKLS